MYNEIAEQFDELGCEVSKETLEKCVELCTTYDIGPVEFVEQWMAYSVSNLNGAEPTIPFLVEMERKIFASIKNKETDTRKKKVKIYQLYDSKITAIYGNPTVENNIDEDVIMDTYNCKTPKTQKATVARTPARENSPFCNLVIYSPISATTRTQSEKTGKVVYTFGHTTLIKQASWVSTNPKKIVVQQLLKHNNETLTAKTKYMYDTLRERSWLLGDRLLNISQEICKKVLKEQSIDILHYDNSSQDQVKLVGTIACDFDGKLDPASTILVDARPLKCSTLELDFTEMKSYSVFPGQTVAISGSTNYKFETITVKEIISERILTRPIPPQITSEIHFVIISGPYINQDDLLSDSLHDIIFYCKEHKPDVLIMTSPLIDAGQNIIMRNDLLETSFDNMIADLIEALGKEITICIVSSHNDILANAVYPTPPIPTKHSFANVHMLPDPSIINVNGFSIGITSTDIVKHLCEEELAFNAKNRMDRIVGYLFHQQSFYPLNPPNINVPVDLNLANKFAKIENIPNVMILPSSQDVFIRDVSGCLALNPGKICSEKNGTFAHLTIYPPKDEASLSNYMACRVMKV